jgi:hypothetical protein
VIKGGTPSRTFTFFLENTVQDGPEHLKINNLRYPLKRIAHTAQTPQPIAFIEESKLLFHMPYIQHKYNYCNDYPNHNPPRPRPQFSKNDEKMFFKMLFCAIGDFLCHYFTS